MTLSEIKTKLDLLEVDVVYRASREPLSTPFIAFYETSSNLYGADNLNLLKRKGITVELYTDKKDIELEEKFESIFNFVELSKNEVYISDENVYQIIYEFEIYEK
jgi:hypothetical protein